MNAFFATFDVFPLPKGASTHIGHVVSALSERFNQVFFASLGYGDMPGYQEEGNVIIYRCLADHPNFLRRTEYYYSFLERLLDRIAPEIGLVHYRDIWSGMPILRHARLSAPSIFEVNGLPSIELPSHYPGIIKNRGLMNKIQHMEDFCLSSARRIITVSRATERYLLSRGVRRESISVVPNTVDMKNVPPLRKEENKPDEILYAGTLASWQGIGTLLEAFSLIAPSTGARLVIVCSNRKNIKPVKKLIARNGIEGAVRLDIGLPQQELFHYYRKAAVTVAPLSRSARNEVQGCSPLKILESMACGTPVVASRLPACEEIITHDVDGFLVAPDSPRALATALAELLADRDRRMKLGEAAAVTFNSLYRHDLWREKMDQIYSPFVSS
jgi:glycosyltransferase involved in cell wall biosynthesis